ncbi:MAG: hypothetical protein K2N73_11070 [Lachnospiraceae bacterium]|nr:hypothetical protein [Lachnospiraceae bacterium]
MTTKHTKLRLAALLFTLVCLASMRHLEMAVAALFNENNAVHIDPDAIESSTLIIGTHLIYLHAMNEEIYAAAMDSAALSGQDRRFYKSELAGGMWVEITDAGSLRDITAAGNIIGKEEIQALYFTHHTRSDKITYDLRTNAKVCVFDIYNVYDLENMPELEPLKLQYDIMKESGSTAKATKRSLSLVQNFFAMQVTSDTTDACDRQLQALQGYYDELVTNGADSRDSEMVLKVMEKIDNSRKAAVFTMVEGGLASLQDSASNVSGDEDLDLDDTLLTAIGNSQNAISESMSAAQGNMLARGDTVIAEMEYAFSGEMITNAMESNYFGCDGQNRKLQCLENISDGIIVDRKGETDLLNELIDNADVAYGQKLSGGVSGEYMTLVAQNVSHAALQSRMKEDMADANAARGELEFYIQGKVDRLEREEAKKYILLRIQDAAKFKASVKADAYLEEYQNAVSSYVDWLNTLLDSIRSNGSSQTEEEGIYEQKVNLQQQKLQALDELDLDTAKKIDAQIADIDAQIDSAEGYFADQLNELIQRKAELEKELAEDSGESGSPGDSAAVALQVEISRLEVEIAENRMGLSENSQAANIIKSKNEILSLLADGDTGDSAAVLMESNIGVLVAMLEEGSPLAQKALKEVYQKLLAKSELEGVGDYRALQDKIETAISDSVVNSSLSGEMTVQGAQGIIADVLGIGPLTDGQGNIVAGIPKEDLAAVLIALGEFNKKTGRIANADAAAGEENENGAVQSSHLQALVEGLAFTLCQSNDNAVFQTKRQGSESYVPAETLANYLGYRYIWNDTKKNAILSRGKYFYRFTAFQENVMNEKGEIIYMDSPAGFSGGIYIPGSFVENTFACYSYEIYGTNYSVLVNDKAADKSQELLLELLEKGGF